VNLTIRGRRNGSSRVALLQNGNRPVQIRYCGFMGNVRVWGLSHTPIFAEISGFEFAAGAGKSVIWYVHPLVVPRKEPILFV
jgi:hypothetical protein